MPTIQEIAADFSRRFEGAVRDDGTKYRRVKEGEQSEALTALVYAAHGDMLPDDWRYAFIEQSLDAIAENGEDAQLEPAVYTSELTSWLNSRADRCGYCDAAVAEYGSHPSGTFDLLQWGMAQEQQEVLASVLHSLNQLAEEETEVPAGGWEGWPAEE